MTVPIEVPDVDEASHHMVLAAEIQLIGVVRSWHDGR